MEEEEEEEFEIKKFDQDSMSDTELLIDILMKNTYRKTKNE
jgi:hypothetical protein